ncbi:MAG: HlyC/CorC family transporter [Clostridia bacterium]|nr:HlyC/CorC family transporter [Clostridia bacterium]
MEIMLVIVLCCVVMSAYFSATETAFSTFNRIRMKNIAEKGNKRAELVLKLSENYDTLISTILIGNNIVNILASSLATLLFAMWIVGNEGLSTTLSTVVMTLIVLTFGEIVPKTLAKQFPEKFSMFSAPLINLLRIVLWPISIIFRGLQKFLSKIFKNDDDKGMTEEELISIIEEAEEDGGLDEEEGTLIKSAIEFNDMEVSEILTPRIDITAVRSDVSKEELAKVYAESGYSRIPIYESDLDNITGIVYYKDFFTECYHTDTPISEIVKPIIFVTKTQKINDLLKDLQEKQLHLAVVSDEYGSTAGIVTLEDIIEEIVGEIWDEHDEIVEEIKQISEKEYIVSGKANIDKLFDELDIELPEGEEESDAMTVNGWAMDILGKIAEEGDSFEALGLTVKVLKMEGRRIENLHILDTRVSEDDEADDDAAETEE